MGVEKEMFLDYKRDKLQMKEIRKMIYKRTFSKPFNIMDHYYLKI